MGFEWKDVGAFIGKAAPILGGVLSGPVGLAVTAAGGLVSSLCGTEAKPDAVLDALKASPDLVLELQKAEIAHQDKLLEWQTAQVQADVQNVISARNAEVAKAQAGYAGAWGTPIVAIIVTLGFAIMLGIMVTRPSGYVLNDAATLLLGQLAAGFAAVVGYYLGSSSGSARKDALLANSTPITGGK